MLARPVSLLALAACLAAAGAAAAPAAPRSCSKRAPANRSGPAVPEGARLVPAGATSVLLCRYDGLNPPVTSLRLAASRAIHSAATVAALRLELNRLPQAPRLIMCPMDDGSEVVATFMRGASTFAVVDVGLSGCRLVHGGGATWTATGPAGRKLLSLLASLVG